MTTITPAERNDALSHLPPMREGDEYSLYMLNPAAWAARAEPVWRVLMVKSDSARRKELLALAGEHLRERLESWLAEYARLHKTDRAAWARFAAPVWRVVLSCADPGPKRELWARMDPELKAALKALAEQTELEKAA